MSPQQQAFEAWCESTNDGRKFPYTTHHNNLDTQYVFYVTQHAFEGWSAANARMVGIMGDLKEKLAGKPDAAKMVAVLSALQEMCR